jgi:hypothetical protein
LHAEERSRAEQKQTSENVCDTMKIVLVALLKYRHDEAMENSHRHQGFGWSAEVVDKKFRDKAKEKLREIQL